MDVGNYTLLHMLGRGGTSEVYAARHRERGDSVALKLVRTSDGDDLLAEATRVRDIGHTNVVRIIEAGRDADACYLVMELIEGETLAARLQSAGRIDELTLRELGAAMADGMQAAHARGIVHRDLKPGNVMLRGDAPVIVDFGIAKSLGRATAAVTERRIGTVAYMAPEQLVEGLITPAVDIWALGVTLYEAATGQLPFTSFQDGRLPQLFEVAPRVSTTSPRFADLIARCLERDPGKRPASMADIARALRADDGERVTADIGSTTASRSSNDGDSTMVVRRAKARWPMVAVIVGVAASATVVIARHEPTKALPASSPTTAAAPPPARVHDAPASSPAVVPPVATPPVAGPIVEGPARPAKRPKRVLPAKRHTTSQGETLD